MYETKNKADNSTKATEDEIIAAKRGKLLPRERKGGRNQQELVQEGTNGMPAGRPIGTTTGLPVNLAVCYVFQQNEKAPKDKKLTDQGIAEWLRKEFPGRKTGYWDQVQLMRWKYNQGKFTRGMKPTKQSHRYDSGGALIDPKYGKGT